MENIIENIINEFGIFEVEAILNNMTLNQIEWCKDKGIIENLKPEVTKQLNMCAFYAVIPSDLINEFDAL